MKTPFGFSVWSSDSCDANRLAERPIMYTLGESTEPDSTCCANEDTYETGWEFVEENI
jgi:hypothetical protein